MVSIHKPAGRGRGNQICGVGRSFMPVEIDVAAKTDFRKWLATAERRFVMFRAPANPSIGSFDGGLAAVAASGRLGISRGAKEE